MTTNVLAESLESDFPVLAQAIRDGTEANVTQCWQSIAQESPNLCQWAMVAVDNVMLALPDFRFLRVLTE